MLNEIELTILALVAEGPRYAADIDQMIATRGLREWLLVGSSSVGYTLKKLEEQALVTTRLDGQSRPVYELTEAGQGVLQTAVAHLLRQPRPLGTGVELGLANLKVLKPAQVYQALVQRHALLRQQLETTASLWDKHQKDGSDSDETRALYTHGIALMKAELEWLEQFAEDWRKRYPAVVSAAKGGDGKATRIHRQTSPLNPSKVVQRMKRPSGAE